MNVTLTRCLVIALAVACGCCVAGNVGLACFGQPASAELSHCATACTAALAGLAAKVSGSQQQPPASG